MPLRPPDLTGPAGRAWKVQIAPDLPTGTTGVALWVLHLPGIVPFWSWYAISVVHLRDQPGTRPAVIQVEGATHEVLVMALDPEAGPPGEEGGWDLDRPEQLPRHLSPLEVVRQIVGITDEGGQEIANQLASAAVTGLYVPDSDRRALHFQTPGTTQFILDPDPTRKR